MKLLYAVILAVLIIPITMAFNLPNSPGTIINNNFTSTLESMTDNITWVRQVGPADTYVTGHDGTANGALYFNTGNPFYELNETPANAGNQVSFYWEVVAKCNSTDVADRTIIIADGGDDIMNFEVDTTDTELNPNIRDEDLDAWNPGTVSGATIVGDFFSYHALARNCTGAVCDWTYFYNGSALAWDNSTAADGAYNAAGTAFYLGSNSVQTRDAEDCSVSHYRMAINENLTPFNASRNYDILFNNFSETFQNTSFNINGSVNLTPSYLNALWEFDEDNNTPGYNSSMGNASTFNLTNNSLFPAHPGTRAYPGKLNLSQYFNGTDGTCSTCSKLSSLGQHEPHNVPGYGYGMWIRPNTTDVDFMRVFGISRDAASEKSTRMWLSDTGVFTFEAKTPPSSRSWTYTATDIFDGNWHFIGFNYDFEAGPATYRGLIYYDGAIVENSTQVNNVYNASANPDSYVHFGGDRNSDDENYKGWIDQTWYSDDSNEFNNKAAFDFWYNNGSGLNLFPGGLTFINYSNFINLSNSLWYNNLSVETWVDCPSQGNFTVTFYTNDTANGNETFQCQDTNTSYSTSYVNNFTGLHNVSLLYNFTQAEMEPLNGFYGNVTFYADINEPVAEVAYNITNAFNSTNITLTLNCTDEDYTPLFYNITYNDTTALSGNFTNASLQTVLTEADDGENILIGFCSDLFTTVNETINFTLYKKFFYFWDEIDNVAFDTSNVTTANVYFDDNSTSFDFKSGANVSNVTFLSNTTDKLRFELGYPDDILITRYVDVSLFEAEDEIKVCANTDTITHFTQLIISSVVRPVKVESVFTGCTVGADYTRFAYQDAFVLKVFTIANPYNLIVWDTDVVTEMTLTGLDGSIASFYNIDTLEFKQEGYNLNILGQALSFQKTSDTQMTIYYSNLEDDITSSLLTIVNMDNDTTVTTVTPADPDNFTVLFDWTTIGGVTNDTLFKVTVTATDSDGDSTTTTRYMNTSGSTGAINGGLAVSIALLLGIFGLTFTVSRSTFSWFGILIILAAITVLTFAIQEWYVTFMITVYVILLVYSIILMTNKNFQTVA